MRRRIAYETGAPKKRRRLMSRCYLYPPQTRMRIPDDDEDEVL